MYWRWFEAWNDDDDVNEAIEDAMIKEEKEFVPKNFLHL